MEIQNDLITSAPIDAATLLILKDSSDGSDLEVFMLRRHVKSSVLGGVYVFPGGKLDKRDENPVLSSWSDVSADALRRSLNEFEISDALAQAVHVAAIRETFEECGVLFAKPAPERTSATLAESSGEDQFLAHLGSHGLILDLGAMVPFSRWVTPQLASLMSKRFDTRFFLAKNPAQQIAQHDNVEATDSAWFTPRQALQKYWDHEIELAPPQVMSLVNLSFFKSADEALSYYRGKPPAWIRPQPFDEEGVRHICYPGHARHDQREKVMRGPDILRFVNQRFEPIAGFEGFFVE
jgi:8-oxo-dGTP pyrophosphatase MutT (NUDIX family)